MGCELGRSKWSAQLLSELRTFTIVHHSVSCPLASAHTSRQNCSLIPDIGIWTQRLDRTAISGEQYEC